MKKLNLYISKQLLVGFLLVAFSLLSILWLTQSLRFVELITSKGLPVSIFVEMTSLLMPRLFVLLSPISIFIACLFTFNRLLSDRELVVMKSAGISPWQSSKAVFLVGGILTVFSIYMNNFGIPGAEKSFSELEWKVKNDLSHLLFREGEFTTLQSGLTIFITSQEKNGSVSGILINDERDPQKKVTVVADKGRIVYSEDKPRILLIKGARQEINLKDSQFSSLSFDRYSVDFATPSAGKKKDAGVRSQNLFELLSAGSNPNLTPQEASRYMVEGHKRLLNPFYNILFALLGCVGFLIGSFNRRGQAKIIFTSIFFMVIIQAGDLAYGNMAVKRFYLLPLLYINFFVPLIICLCLLKFNRISFFPKRKKETVYE